MQINFHKSRGNKVREPPVTLIASGLSYNKQENSFLTSKQEWIIVCTTKEIGMETCKTTPLDCCLFFTANSLARDITRMGEEEFASIGMTPSYAFLMLMAIDAPGISQKEISAGMNMAASTVSRFIDALVKRKLLLKDVQGRVTLIHPTEKGMALEESIREVWGNLFERYSKILGEKQGKELTRLCLEASRKLQQE